MSVSTLTSIQTYMNSYGYPAVIVLGTIGNIFTLIFFSRQRNSPCSLYLMHSAISNLLYLLQGGFTQIFPITYYDQTLGMLLFCKFNIYMQNFLGQVAKTTLILACIDRYMITSDKARFRAFSTPKRAKYAIILTYIFWLIAASHVLIWTAISNGRCTRFDIYITLYTIYIILFVGVIPSVILCVFGCLTYRNMRSLHRRIQPGEQNGNNASNSLQRRDRNLLVIVIAEVIVYIITTSLFPAILLETTISQYLTPNKSLQYSLAESFVRYLAILLLNIFSAAPFYIYIISSKSFRRDFKHLIMNRCLRLTRQPSDQTTLRVGTRVTQGDTHV